MPLRTFLNDALVPYETDEVTRLIMDTHDAASFARVSHMTVGDFRDWLPRLHFWSCWMRCDRATKSPLKLASLRLCRGTVGTNVMYFETGEGSALSGNAHHGIDQQTLEARAGSRAGL